jgi:hypothetical protein
LRTTPIVPTYRVLCGGLPTRTATIQFARVVMRLRVAVHVVGTKQESERCFASAQARRSVAFVHDLPRFRKRLMLERSLQVEFESYRKTLSIADRLAFDESIERLLSQHGIDYVRGYVDALKQRGSQ